jgi:hypothetical protein
MKAIPRFSALSQKIRNKLYRKRFIQEYVPRSLVKPERMIQVTTAWSGLEQIIPDILDRFDVKRTRCLEFGVEFGYSTVAFSNYFDKVLGLDTFEGDAHTTDRSNHFESTRDLLSKYSNIELHRSSYQEWITHVDGHYDFAHVDIIHSYKHTFRCGLWAAQHSDVTIFHDTESFVDVRNAVTDIAKAVGKNAYNYLHHHGLGIVA